jgi:c-di-GMP-binding flagellar brake protein YcgR
MREIRPTAFGLYFCLKLSLSLSAFLPLCFWPSTPALADSDITSQFPDQLSGQTMAPVNQEPWVVDQYRGGRRRQKRFNAPQDNQYTSGPMPSTTNFSAFNNNGGDFGNGGFGPGFRGNQSPRPDKFADFPDTDAAGIRHFANGRHYDLKNISIEQAVATSAAGDQQIAQETAQARRQQRNRSRMRNGF